MSDEQDAKIKEMSEYIQGLERRINRIVPWARAFTNIVESAEHENRFLPALEDTDLAPPPNEEDMRNRMYSNVLAKINLGNKPKYKVDKTMERKWVWKSPTTECKALNKEDERISDDTELVCWQCEREWLGADALHPYRTNDAQEIKALREPSCGHTIENEICTRPIGHSGKCKKELWTATDIADYKAVLDGACGHTIETVSNRVQVGRCNLKKDHDGTHQWMMPLPKSAYAFSCETHGVWNCKTCDAPRSVDVCQPHRKFPCRECGTKHYRDCACPYCICESIQHTLTGPLKCILSDHHDGDHKWRT